MVGLMNICGIMGGGKTVLATDIARRANGIWVNGFRGIPVYANYDIDFINCEKLKIDMLMKFDIQKNEKILVIIDEAYAWIESRSSMTDLNKYITMVLFQSRKRGIEMITTEQLTTSIDTRFQQLAEINVGAIQTRKGFRYIFYLDGIRKAKRDLLFKDASKFWNCYNTDELILPPKFDELQSKMETLDTAKLDERITLLADVFHREKGTFAYRVTQSIVDDFILVHSKDLGTTSNLAYPLYGRLKSQYEEFLKDNKGGD